MAATLKDIAVRVGLSEVSVSQALRGTGRLSTSTRSRVMEVARELRYRPHALAQSMRQGRTGIIGLIYGHAGDRVPLSMAHLAGIQRELAASGYELMLGEIPPDELLQGRPSALLRQWMADGLLINHQLDLPASVAELVEEDHVAAIWMNNKLTRNCVHLDDAGAARTATEHLLKLGHRRIAYLDYSHKSIDLQKPEHYSIIDRAAGYAGAMREVGLQPIMIMRPDGVGHGERLKFCVQALRAPDRPTAVLCYAESTLVVAAAMQLGLRIPRDLSIVGFDSSLTPILDLPMTTLLVSWQELGRRSAARLIELIKSPSEPVAPLAVQIELVVQQSTAPPADPAATRA